MNDIADWEGGRDGEECESWILGVKQQAFARGMDKDDEWIARFVATRIGGPALP